MTKKIIMPNTLDISLFLPYVDAFLFGVKGYSTNHFQTFEYELLKPVIHHLKEQKKEVFLNLNKNMHEQDLKGLSKLLNEIEEVDGIFYYDIAILELVKKQNIKIPLIWAQEHMTTNYHTVNYWKENGAKGTLLSSEITLDEILEIRQNTKSNLFVPIFGYLPMFTSKRKLITNYLETFALGPKQEEVYFMEKEDKIYPLIENEEGTTAYSSFILNGLREYFLLKEHNIDYVCFNAFLLQDLVMQQVLELWNNTTESNKDENAQKLDEMLLKNTETGFFYKETVYKVKV